jgi:hypothetical protein
LVVVAIVVMGVVVLIIGGIIVIGSLRFGRGVESVCQLQEK